MKTILHRGDRDSSDLTKPATWSIKTMFYLCHHLGVAVYWSKERPQELVLDGVFGPGRIMSNADMMRLALRIEYRPDST